MSVDDFSFGWEHRAHITELQDIAAMDRLAAQVAPTSSLRRYGREKTGARARRSRPGWWLDGVRRVLHPAAHR